MPEERLHRVREVLHDAKAMLRDVPALAWPDGNGARVIEGQGVGDFYESVLPEK
jgi:hypothetical protein